MILITILFLGLILGLAFTVALRSMKDFQERPSSKVNYGTFLIKDPSQFTSNFIEELNKLSLTKEARQKNDPPIISFEHLIRGKQIVIVVYAPKELMAKLPLKLLELEDYTSKIPVTYVNCFELALTNKSLTKDFTNVSFTQGLEVDQEEYLFLQIVSSPIRQTNSFQITVRVVVSARDSIRRITLARAYEANIKQATSLARSPNKRSSSANFEDYKRRGLLPGEVKKFILSSEDIFSLVKT